MNTIQIIALVVTLITVVGAVIAGAWINQRAIERQMDAFRNEIKAEMAALRADVRADIAPLSADIAQVKQSVEKIERQLEAIFGKMVWPGKGD
jgi:Tfp pilus assembly protein PilO